MSTRRFEFVGGTSSKFWEIEVIDRVTTTRWGKLGASGQSKVTRAGSSESAADAAEEKIAEKVRKGYKEVSVGARAPEPQDSGRMPVSVAEDLRRLGGPEPTRGVTRAVIEALESSKPVLETDVHQDVATRFLHGMTVERGPKRTAAVKRPEPIDEAVFLAILDRLLQKYDTHEPEFRVLDAMFLLEAILGTERVAKTLVDRCVDIAPDATLREHSMSLVRALEAMKRRLSVQWPSVAAPLTAIKPSNAKFDAALASLVKPTR